MNTIRILLADDHPIYRDGLEKIIMSTDGMKVVGAVGDGQKALDYIVKFSPDIVLLDVSMPELDGVQVAESVRDRGLLCKLIFLTVHDDTELFRHAVQLGVKGCLLKECNSSEVVTAIQKVADGENYISPELGNTLMRHLQSEQPVTKRIDSLTKSELKVLHYVASDRTSKEIAHELGLSVRTIETHRARICKKLNLAGAHSLVKFAFEHKGDL